MQAMQEVQVLSKKTFLNLPGRATVRVLHILFWKQLVGVLLGML